jgi:hypothetical protein
MPCTASSRARIGCVVCADRLVPVLLLLGISLCGCASTAAGPAGADAGGDAPQPEVSPDAPSDAASDAAPDAAAATCLTAWPMPNPPSTGLPHPQDYDTSAPEVVRDNVTGLLWQRSTFPAGYNWNDANAACADLTLGGLTGWRLPRLVELVSLVDFTRSDPAIDTDAFPGTASAEFWAVETDLTIPGLGWYVYFLNGGAYGGNDVSDIQQVRCVLATASPPPVTGPCYQPQDQTVLDTRTTLTWQQTTDPGSFSWSDAQSYCGALVLDGPGWRLPSVKELMTLVDLSRADPATNVAIFPDATSDYFWSSSPVSGSTTAAWGVSFNKGSSGTAPTDFQSRVRCVR